MTTSEQQGAQPLTRKQLRELRSTGATPVIDEENVPARADAPAPMRTDVSAIFASSSPAAPGAEQAPSPRVPSLSELFSTGPAPTPAEVEDAAPAVPSAPTAAIPDDTAPAEPAAADPVPESPSPEPALEPAPERTLTRRELRELEKQREGEDATPSAETPVVRVESPVEPGEAAEEPASEEEVTRAVAEWPEPLAATEQEAVPEVSASLGHGLLERAVEPVESAVDFDDLVAPLDTTGSQHVAPTALIFNQTPGPLTLSGPLGSGGDILVTGSYELPASVGSHGHAPGMTDGKDIDAALVDSELAVSSSPAPVAASSAIGTIKPAGEVMRQPAPEKGSKLLMGLAITAGGLMIALSVALILAFTNGVF